MQPHPDLLVVCVKRIFSFIFSKSIIETPPFVQTILYYNKFLEENPVLFENKFSFGVLSTTNLWYILIGNNISMEKKGVFNAL